MTGIAAALRAAVAEHPDEASDTIARRFVARVTKAQLVALVAHDVRDLQRERTRGVERRAFARLDPPPVPKSGDLAERLERPSRGYAGRRDRAADEVSCWRRIAGQTIRLGDGTNPTWGQARVAQHESRIVMLRGNRDGIDRTIGRHERAIRAIREAGVECLDDLIAATDEGAAA